MASEALLSSTMGPWPNLWDESREMLEGAILAYTFADLRSLARKKKLSVNHERLLQLPVSPSDVLQVVQANLDDLKKEIVGIDFYLSSLESIKASVFKPSIDPASGEAVLHDSKLVIFDDENAARELVYGIAVNGSRRRITVAFRGSVTLSDFMTDAKAIMTDIQNPVKGGKPRTVGIHHGFSDYFYGSKRANDKKSKCEAIMEQVVGLLQQYPGYKVYVTGHSLGGALATLFAFEAAADSRIPGPVTCVNIASPRVGNLAFRRAFQSLEQSGQLRCLRISNYKDLVTVLPDRGTFSLLYILCCQSRIYRHVGVGLKLYPGGRHEIERASDSDGCLGVFCQDLGRQIKSSLSLVATLPFVLCCREDFLKYHGCREYMERLLANERSLTNKDLNQFYN